MSSPIRQRYSTLKHRRPKTASAVEHTNYTWAVSTARRLMILSRAMKLDFSDEDVDLLIRAKQELTMVEPKGVGHG